MEAVQLATYKRDEELNSGLPRANPASGRVDDWINDQLQFKSAYKLPLGSVGTGYFKCLVSTVKGMYGIKHQGSNGCKN